MKQFISKNIGRIVLTILMFTPSLGAFSQYDEIAGSEELTEPIAFVDFTPFYKYRVYLKDKKGSLYSIARPEEFLSAKSIERRKKQGLKIDETDIPVNRNYLEKIESCGVELLHCSKWNNTVLVQTSDTTLIDKVASLSCVTSVRKVATYESEIPTPDPDRANIVSDRDSDPSSMGFFEGYHNDLINRYLNNSYKYGGANTQIKLLNGIALHEQGYRGKGMTIAVIDGGFYNADVIPYFKNVNILGTKDFARKGGDVYGEEEHGTMVLSTMATNCRGKIIGTAPEASYWLLRSEDGHTEQMVEEDNWCAAIEFADSVGVYVVNTSLGYTKYDNPADNVRYWEQDGQTRLISKSASMAASKGMVLCQSAGNEGDDTWKRIGCPADAKDILSVGAVDSDRENTTFSSIGNSYDGRIKPDVCSMGMSCTVVDQYGDITTAAGTSFSSPILCGMVACYWQAHPNLTAIQVIENIRKISDNAEHPDNVFGYGIPDFSK